MPLDPDIQTILDGLAAEPSPSPETLTVAQNRELGLAFAAFSGDQVPVASVHDTVVPAAGREVPIRVYIPTNPSRPQPHVTVFFHGGGWVMGDLDSQDHMGRWIAERSGTIVVSVHYRRGPEDRFPAAVDDALAAVEWVAENAATLGGDGSRIALFGESAGANIAAVVAQEAPRRGAPNVVFQALAYPATDRFDDSPSMHEFAAGPLLTRSWLEWFWGAYLATPDLGADVRVSPLQADDLEGLAPALILTAEYDILRDQGERYVDKLRAAGVAVEHRRVPGAPHAFLSFTGGARIAREALDQLGDAIGAALR